MRLILRQGKNGRFYALRLKEKKRRQNGRFYALRSYAKSEKTQNTVSRTRLG